MLLDATNSIGHLFREYFLCYLQQLGYVLSSLGLTLDATYLIVSPFKGIHYLDRSELGAVKNQRTLLEQSEQINGLVNLASVMPDLFNEFPSQDVIRGKAVFEHSL